MASLRGLTLAALTGTALAGSAAGLALITDPSGATVGLSADTLPGWLLGDFLVPGFLVAVLFGLLPARAALLVRRRSPRGWSAASTVGVLMVLWSLGQLAVIGFPHPLVQAAFLIAGIGLTGLGLDGGTTVGDESRRVARSYEHAD